jgi:GTP pyrophosphokinase
MLKEYATSGMSKKQFLDEVSSQNPRANVKLISKAYDFAKESHRGQKRESGADFFIHSTDVAFILTHWRQDSPTISAGLLHDVLEDTKVKPEELKKLFGADVAQLVEGVTKIKSINLEITHQEKAENLRKIIFATIKDIRVILIKLADRLQNMRTLKYKPKKEQLGISNDTLDIYVPIAYKLGMYRLKSELEDLCLRFMQPDVYQELKKRIAKKKKRREKEVKRVIRSIRKKLAEKGLEAKVYGRAKNFHSIYKKMLKKNISFDEIRDLSAVRIITNSVDDCYRALGIIHSTWTPIPKRFDDYIATPKPNMYQSLHTEIMFNKNPVEIQIRTREMHHLAEEGIAAHWLYSGTERDKKFDRRVAWLKQILEWKISDDARDFIESIKVDLFKDEIFVFTPKGDPIALPEKATPVDFAYMVHTDIGNHCVRAKVNNNIAPLYHELDPGDVIEIITAKNAKPSRSWLRFVKTNQARTKIRQALGITHDELRHNEFPSEKTLENIEARGFNKSALKLPKCCNMKYGDEIVGYIMKDGKIAVHKFNCVTLKGLPEKRKIRLMWKEKEKKPLTKVIVEIIDRVGLFADIVSIFSKQLINVESVNTKNVRDKFYIIFEVKQTDKLKEIINQIKQVRNVVNVRVE